MTDLDFSLERDSEGNLCCPHEGCPKSFATHKGISDHHGWCHDESIAIDIVGADKWSEFLHTELIENSHSGSAIARSLPEHIGEETVLGELRRLGYWYESPSGPINFGTQIISMPHIRTIEQAQEEAKRRREAQP